MPDEANLDQLRERVAALEAERRTLLDILDLAPFFVYAIDEQGYYKLANRAVAEDLGHTPRSIVGVRWQDVVPDVSQAEAIMALVPGKIAGGVPVVTRDVPLYLNSSKTNAIIELYEAPFRDGDGKDWLLGIARDKTSELELERERLERTKLDRDLAIARTIQQSLLPTTPPERPGLDVAGWTRPADDTGGDFYDWFTTPAGVTYLMLGDVTGHGIGPALIAATTRAYARAVLDGPGRLDAKVARLNDLLAEELPDNLFVTLAVAEVPPDRAAASFVAAGHGPTCYLPPQRFGGGAVRLLGSHGPPLGIVAGVAYEPPTPIPLLRGARLLLASDGLHETLDASRKLLGVEPIAEAVGSGPERASELLESLRHLVEGHAAGQAQADDMTAIAVTAVRQSDG